MSDYEATINAMLNELRAEVERLHGELAVWKDKYKLSQETLAAERAARITIASPVRQEGEE